VKYLHQIVEVKRHVQEQEVFRVFPLLPIGACLYVCAQCAYKENSELCNKVLLRRVRWSEGYDLRSVGSMALLLMPSSCTEYLGSKKGL
jgi:hypothetical protein